MATAQEYADWIVRNADKKGTPEFETVAKAYKHSKALAQTAADDKKFAFDPERDMSAGQRFVAGYGKAGADLVRGVGQMVGLVSRDDVKESRKLDAPLMNTTAGTVGNVTGNLAAFAPTAMIPGANTVTGGALVGAGLGLVQPSADTGETLRNVAFGGVAGAVVPAVTKGYQAVKAAAEPFHESGKNAIVGRALNRAAGNDAPAVAQRLQEAATPFVGPSQQGAQRTIMGEFVPGSVPTVGQASGNAGVASLERAAVATNPEVTNAVSALMKEQNGARVNVLEDLAGTDGRRLFMGEARDATANQLYSQARRAGIDPQKLTPQVMQDLDKLSQRIPASVMDRARELAKIKGEPMDNATSLQGLHWVKQALDDKIGEAARAGNDTLKAAYTGLKEDFLSQLDHLSPAYKGARETYSAMSRPINQMDVAAEIANKSVDKLTGNIQPRNFAKAVQSDATAARATGLSTATMEQTMEPSQMNALRSILLDLRRAEGAQTAGRMAGSDTVQKLAYSNILDQAGVPTFLRELGPLQFVGNVGGRVMDAGYARANRELSNRLAEVMLDPGSAAKLMQSVSPEEANMLLRLVGRTGSGVALTAPAATNARQQQ